MADISNKTIIASIMHAPICGQVDICRDALMTVGSDGQIIKVIRPNEPNYEKKKSEARASDSLVQLPSNQVFTTGFCRPAHTCTPVAATGQRI